MTKKVKQYSEAELIKMFGLVRLVGNDEHPLMVEWTNASTILNDGEQYLFDLILVNLLKNISKWKEEALKMNFISFVLKLGYIEDTDDYSTYYEETIEATLGQYFLKLKCDFMLAKGVLDIPETPYFHFQEYKKEKDPYSDPDAQLMEALLIAQHNNNNNQPLYGCSIKGRRWDFFIMQSNTYCISKAYDCTDPEDLLKIIAMLRKFKEILETRLLAK